MQPGSHPFADLEAALARRNPRPDAARSVSSRTDHGCWRRDPLLGGDTGPAGAHRRPVRGAFTLTDTDEAGRFLPALGAAAVDRAGVCTCSSPSAPITTPGSIAIPRLGPLFADNVINVVPMRPDDLEAAATSLLGRLDVEDDGVSSRRLIADVQVNRTRCRCSSTRSRSSSTSATVPRSISRRTNVRWGPQAVAQRAESSLFGLDAEEQEAVRQLFLRIATVAGDAEGRRRIPAFELTELAVDVVALQAAIEASSRHRLLTLDRDPATGAPTIEGGARRAPPGVASPARVARCRAGGSAVALEGSSSGGATSGS